MLITDKFVMLNFPKTGSSFARDVIKKIHSNKTSTFKKIIIKLGYAQPSVTELMLPKIDERQYSGIKDQHGTYRQIPENHRNKNIVSVVRHPCDRYVSTYLYRWWEKFPPADINEIKKGFCSFPDLDFSEYYEMIHRFGRWDRLRENSLKFDVGYISIQFAQFYFNDPLKILRLADDGNFKSIKESEEIRKIHFLHQENLNEELKIYLLQSGYSKKDVNVIENYSRVNVTLRHDHQKDAFSIIPPEVHKKIVEREALLFYLFPEYKKMKATL